MLLVFMTDDVHITQSSFGELTQCKPQATQVVVALTSRLVYALLVAFVHRKPSTVRPYNGRVVHSAESDDGQCVVPRTSAAALALGRIITVQDCLNKKFIWISKLKMNSKISKISL